MIPTSAQEIDADLSEINKILEPLSPYPTPVKTATFFGNKGNLVVAPTDGSIKLPGGINSKYLPVAVPHISVGNIFGTRALIRFVPAYKSKTLVNFLF